MKFNMKQTLILMTTTIGSLSMINIGAIKFLHVATNTNIKTSNLKISKIITAPAQGDAYSNRINANLGLNHSQFSPTGIFVTKNSVIDIFCPEVPDNVYVFVGQWGPYKNLNAGKALNPEQIVLNKGTTTVFQPKIDGMLYLSNQSANTDISMMVNVLNGIEVPTFNVDETTSEAFNQQLTQTTSPFVEIVGKHVFGTFQIALANDLWKNNISAINKINDTVKNWDEIYQYSNYVSGLDLNYDGIAKKHHNLIHIGNPDTGAGYAYATNYYVGFQQNTGAGKTLFTSSLSGQWGLWHEIGHTYQNQDYKFDGFGEVSVNINSFWIQEQFGFKNRIFTDTKTIAAIKAHINSDNPNKTINDLDVWGRLGVYLQLHMAYGKEFFPTLNQEYRLLTLEEKPKTNAEKYQTFIRVSSKTANRNLITYFEKWGIHADAKTKEIVKNYPPLTKDIWNNIFDNHIEENAIIDYQLNKYDPISGVKVKADMVMNLNVGSQVKKTEAEKYLTNLTSDMKIENTITPNWNAVNWNKKPIMDYSGVSISQPNKIGNKYLIPTKINANNSLRIQGLGDSYNGIISLNTNDKKFFISPTTAGLHAYYKGKPYVWISVTDDKDNVIYANTANGDDSTMKFQELNKIGYQNNYKIKFWFAEPNRGLYYDNNQWIKASNSSINGNISFEIVNENWVKINN